MALELRPNCEYCDKDLPPDASEARICSFECTFCADCVESHEECLPQLRWRLRPEADPASAGMAARGIARQAAGLNKARGLSYSREEVAAFSREVMGVPPESR